MEPSAEYALAVKLFEAGDLDGVAAVCAEMLRRKKKDVEALRLRGSVALRRGEHAEALKDFRKALELRPRDAQLHFLAGKAHAIGGDFAAAVASFDEALALLPGDAKASEWKAIVLEWAGEPARARKVLEPFLGAGTESAAMAEVAARVALHEGHPIEAIAAVERHLRRLELDAPSRHRMGHVSGRAWERAGDFDKAFAEHAAANRAVAVPFDRAAFARGIDRLIAAFPSADAVKGLPRHPRPGLRHVFIAGMPRSGTTLIEQIIAAHPAAYGASEHPGLSRAAASLDGWPECAAALSSSDLARLAQRTEARLPREAAAAERIVNKHLENWRHLGFAALVFPGSRVIAVRRDPRDVGLSCFMSDILPAAHPWIGDLGDIGFVFRQQERLMAHWKAVLPLPILEVEYEALIDDIDAGVRSIIDFVGLPFDERCLRYWESGRSVMTLSYDQVRQPVYRSAIGRWKRYESHLGPLIEALEGH